MANAPSGWSTPRKCGAKAARWFGGRGAGRHTTDAIAAANSFLTQLQALTRYDHAVDPARLDSQRHAHLSSCCLSIRSDSLPSPERPQFADSGAGRRSPRTRLAPRAAVARRVGEEMRPVRSTPHQLLPESGRPGGVSGLLRIPDMRATAIVRAPGPLIDIWANDKHCLGLKPILGQGLGTVQW